jgi:acetyl esterase
VRLPRPIIQRLAGAPVSDGGNRLDLRAQWICRLARQVEGDGPPTQPVDVLRHEQQTLVEATRPEIEPSVSFDDRSIRCGDGGNVPVRIYRPVEGPGHRPTIVYFHGGGWVLGSIATHHAVCGRLAFDVGAVVVSVEYRLAPDNPFPAAVEDALCAFAWVVERAGEWGGHPDWVAVAGDSAGGNLAAVVSQSTRGGGRARPCWQLLLYPATDLSTEWASVERFACGLFLTRARMRWFRERYTPAPSDRLDTRASPLLCDDLAGLPPGLVVVAHFDILRDEGLAYAERAQAAGSRLAVLELGDLIHGFINMTAVLPAAETAYQTILAHLVRGLRAVRPSASRVVGD